MKDWTEWVNPDMSQDLVDLFGILLALTVIFGPTAGLLIDFITKKLVLKVWSFLPLLTSNIDFQFETDNDKGCRIAGVSVTVGLNILFAKLSLNFNFGFS